MLILILIQTDWHSNSVFLKEFIEKSYFKKKSADDKKFIEKRSFWFYCIVFEYRVQLAFYIVEQWPMSLYRKCRKTLVTVNNILSDRQCRLLITLQTVRTKIRTNWKSFLVCIQNVWHSNWVPERIFAKDIKSIQLVKKDLFGFNGQQTSKH